MSIETITIAVPAASAAEAQRLAREWAAAEPGIRLRTIASVRPREPLPTDVRDPWGEPLWTVVMAVNRIES